MGITVKLKYLRIAPRKVRLVADLIRGKTASEAENLLEFTRKKAARPLQKLLKSAISVAEHNFQKDRSSLYISKITVDEGPTLKRHRFRGFGRIFSIFKRSSHITLSLDDIRSGKKVKKVKKAKKPLAESPADIQAGPPKSKSFGKRPRPKTTIPRPKFKKVAKKMFRRKAF